MKRLCLHAFIGVVLSILAMALHGSEASAQSISDARLGIHQAQVLPDAATASLSLQESAAPRWVKWGLLGALGGAAVFALLSQSAPDPNPVLQDAAVGAVLGFVILGGGVAFYDWVCKPDSASERAGLC